MRPKLKMALYPGSKIGVIGGGQLGRMFILECRRMDYYSAVIDFDIHGPAGQVADKAVHPDNWEDFVRECDIATYEFEHLDINIVRKIEDNIPVYPSYSVLDIKRSRASEKTFLSNKGFPVPDFWIFNDASDLTSLLEKNRLVVKTSTGGYDGKGLFIIKNLSDYKNIREDLKQEIVAEKFVQFEKEISIICARSKKGEIAVYPVVQNVHKDGILLYTIAPANISQKAEKKAGEIVSGLAEALDIIGIICVELFLMENDELLINEFAPRPHNSGHYTMDACDISQFEMLLRAMCELPMPTPKLLCPAAMINILGKGADDLELNDILSVPGTKLHLYGKREVREKRKMGHINILGRTSSEVENNLKYVMDKTVMSSCNTFSKKH
jgi:5-(carboxyamino)imidazole ribonucleotide synthase